MELELPEWLDATFLATTLQGGMDGASKVTVTKVSIDLAVEKGNNYMSRLFRINVNHLVEKQEKSISLIVKVPLTKGLVNELVDTFDFYDKEPEVYKNLLPIINRMVNHEFGPTYFPNSLNNVLILSDLSEVGFGMCDRHKQLDFAHCEYVLKTLAMFHGSSVACKRHYPEIVDLVGKESVYKQNERFESGLKPWIQGSFRIVAGTVSDMGLGKIPEEFILSRVENIGDSLPSICKPKETGLNVLNHGDLWVNNILFQHSSTGIITDVKFIDFQVIRYGSPVLDIIYFMWSSANEDVRETRLDELFEIYRSTLNCTLEELGCEERLTKEELFEDIKEAVDWVLVTICNTLPVLCCDADDVIDMENVKPKDANQPIPHEFLKLYKGKHFLTLLPKVMDQLEAWIAYYT